MMNAAMLFFAFAAALFLMSSYYQWRRARAYRRQAAKLHEVIESVLTEGRPPSTPDRLS